MLILGVDDAGRGPVIGPLILAGVLLTKEQEAKLKKLNIRDSKLIDHPERIRLSKAIKENSIDFFVVKTYPEEIDNSIKNGTNLNTLEAMKTAKIIDELNKKRSKDKKKAIVDCPSVNIPAWTNKLTELIVNKGNLEIVCEHKADYNHVSVGAASILAKVAREEEVEKLKKKYGDIGSGYPSDPVTIDFLRLNGKKLRDEGIFRKSWNTWKKLFPEKGQSTLTDF